MVWNKPRIASAFLGALLCCALGFDAPQAGGRRPAHNLTFEDINPRSATHGQTVQLKQIYAGRGAVLQFVASWCGPCREELPQLEAYAESDRVPVVLVAADEGPAGTENILIVAERTGLTMPILFVPPDAVREVDRNWPHDVLPATYFLDAKGRIRSRRQGEMTPSALEVEAAAVSPSRS